jgi:TolB-like protein/Tfp pilus assembly protein PilF
VALARVAHCLSTTCDTLGHSPVFDMSAPAPSDRVLRFATFELNIRTGELRKKGVKLRLQGQPLQVLETLLKRAGDLVTRHELRAEIWPADTFVDFDHSLHNAIARIRETLGDSAETPRFIETLPRRGYRFIEPVQEATPAGSTACTSPEARPIHALAILPLENLSGDPAHDYFADGMTEALITSLAKIKALRVISRTSAMQYRGARKSLPHIARELNVDAVIEGSVIRSGDRVRIAAQLIHATTDQHLWAESYDRDFRDILSLQSEIAQQVADEVRIVLTPEERAGLNSVRQVNPEAHECYLKARYHWNRRTEESVKKALSYFHRAIDADPTYAPGYAGLADAYNILGYYNALPPFEAYPKGKAAAIKALELDRSFAEPHATLGVVKRDFEWDWSGAEQEFQRAIELNPGCVDAYHWRGTLFSMLGRHADALREKSRALELDPLSVVIRTDLGRMFYFSRDYDRSLEQYRAALDMDANFVSAHLWLAHVYQQKGLLDEAIIELKAGVHLSNDSPYALARLGHGYALAGKLNEACSLLEQLHALSSQRYVSPYDLAIVHVGLQKKEEAFRCLLKALEQRSLWLGYLNVEPQLDPLRSDHRFQDLLQRIGLPRTLPIDAS